MHDQPRTTGDAAEPSGRETDGFLALLPSSTTSLRPDHSTADPGVVLLRLPEAPHGDNTVVITWRNLRAGQAIHHRVGAPPTATLLADGADLFDGLTPGAALHHLTRSAPGVGPAWTPAFYLRSTPTARGTAIDVYTQVRSTADDACYVRLTTAPVPAHATDLGWLPTACSLRERHSRFLGGHEACYRTAFPGYEVEYKYTLHPDADIYHLAADTHHRIAVGSVPGFIPKYHDEFEQWDFTNHLFDVTAPEHERGYISFIPAADGTHIIKRKWFAADALARREHLTRDVRVDTGYDEYLRTHHRDLTVRPLPPFRRRRYDINVEAVDTGHVFCVMYDTCTTRPPSQATLAQCEIEYRRSRTVHEPDEETVIADLENLTRRIECVLARHGQPTSRGHYSKLSFLRKVVASPDAAQRPSTGPA